MLLYWLWLCRHRHLPRPVYKAANLRRTMIEAERRKEQRRKAHSAPGSIVTEPVRKRRIIKEVEWVVLWNFLEQASALHICSSLLPNVSWLQFLNFVTFELDPQLNVGCSKLRQLLFVSIHNFVTQKVDRCICNCNEYYNLVLRLINEWKNGYWASFNFSWLVCLFGHFVIHRCSVSRIS